MLTFILGFILGILVSLLIAAGYISYQYYQMIKECHEEGWDFPS
jgi:hypothetical protein